MIVDVLLSLIVLSFVGFVASAVFAGVLEATRSNRTVLDHVSTTFVFLLVSLVALLLATVALRWVW